MDLLIVNKNHYLYLFDDFNVDLIQRVETYVAMEGLNNIFPLIFIQ